MEDNKSGVKVSEAMTKNPIIAKPDDILPRCARKMLSHNVGCIIIEKDKKLLGIATEKDFVEQAIGKELNTNKTKIKEIMSTGMVITTKPDAGLIEAIRIMVREDVRRLPVIKNGKLVGLLTMRDVLKIQPKFLKEFTSYILREKK